MDSPFALRLHVRARHEYQSKHLHRQPGNYKGSARRGRREQGERSYHERLSGDQEKKTGDFHEVAIFLRTREMARIR